MKLRINKNNSYTINRHFISCSEKDIVSSTKLFHYDTEANSEEITEIELELDWKGVDIQSHLFLYQLIFNFSNYITLWSTGLFEELIGP